MYISFGCTQAQHAENVGMLCHYTAAATAVRPPPMLHSKQLLASGASGMNGCTCRDGYLNIEDKQPKIQHSRRPVSNNGAIIMQRLCVREEKILRRS